MPGEVGQGVAVGAVGLPEPAAAGWSGAGELGEAGYQELLGQPGEEQGDAQAVFGDLVAAAVRDPFDDLVGAEPAQVVADHPQRRDQQALRALRSSGVYT